MKDERMKVLEMLEKQVITAEEAQRLLELLTKPVKGERIEKVKDVACCFTEDFNEKAEAFNEKVEALAKDFAQKLEAVAKDVEPKLKKATQIIIEKTVATVDEVSRAFHEEIKKEDCTCQECAEKPEEECNCGCEEDNEPKQN